MANFTLDSNFIFSPDSELISTPADVGLEYEDVSFSSLDGVKLHGWFIPGRTDCTVLWLHGNSGNISHRVDNILQLNRKLGVGIFIFDYRGYGCSEGTPSETGTFMDAEAALDYLRSRRQALKLIVFGRSLGASIALELAIRQQVCGVILESPFTSVEAMNRWTYPILSAFIPGGAVVRSKYDSLSKIRSVKQPILVLHGDQDEIVPFDMGRELFEAASEPKWFYPITGAGHNDTYIVGGNAYFETLKKFMQASIGD